MKNKKHIDELFRERFRNFEATPSPQVWENIQSELQKKKKDRKVIPLWWKMGGVAALLALLLTVGDYVFNDSDSNTKTIVNTEVANPSDIDNEQKSLETIIQESNNNEVASEEIMVTPDNKSESQENNLNSADKLLKSSDKINTRSNNTISAVAVQNTSVKTSEQVKTTSKNLINRESVGVSEKKSAAVSIANSSEITSEKNSSEKNNPLIKEGMDVTKSEAVTISSEEKSANKKLDMNEVSEENKKSILDAINEQEELKTDDAVVKNDLPEDRWDVAPNFAPVYYNTLSKGSSLDPTFADNSQSGDVNISYGVQVSYNVSKRLSIRTGVSNVDLSYSTGGVELGTGPVASALRTIDYGGKTVVLTAVDQGTFQEQMNMNPDGGFGPITPKATDGAAEISQSIKYYEIPLELKYALLDTKLGVNLIGGLSTLFLGNNEVSVMAGGFRSTLGEANNLTSVSFSTNIGLGFDYKISRKLKFNVEPMFKYQLNPYTDSSVDFQPYYIGVYTGFSFKF